jgi:hypothetical protein
VPERNPTTQRVLIAEEEALNAMLLEDCWRSWDSTRELVPACRRLSMHWTAATFHLQYWTSISERLSYPVADSLIARV